MRAYKVLVFKSRNDNFEDVSFPKDWKVHYANPRFFNPSLIENGLKAVVSNREDIRKTYRKYDIPTYYVEDGEVIEDGEEKVQRQKEEKQVESKEDSPENIEDTSVSFDLDSIIADKEAKEEAASNDDEDKSAEDKSEDFTYEVDVDPSEEETDETYRLKNMQTPLREDWRDLAWLDARTTAKLYTEDTIRNKEHAFEVLQQVADEQADQSE